MRRKKIIVVIIVLIIMSIIFVVVCSSKKITTPEKLIDKLEKAINQHNKEILIESFPDFMKSDMVERISQDKMEEFYNNVIGDKALDFQIISKNKTDLESAKILEEIIENEYKININITDYQLIQIKYHEDFETPVYEIIKVDGEYYLYSGGDYPSPIVYFYD